MPFAFKDGQTHWFAEIAQTTRKQQLDIHEANAKGQFIAVLIDGADQSRGWLTERRTRARRSLHRPAPKPMGTRRFFLTIAAMPVVC